MPVGPGPATVRTAGMLPAIRPPSNPPLGNAAVVTQVRSSVPLYRPLAITSLPPFKKIEAARPPDARPA